MKINSKEITFQEPSNVSKDEEYNPSTDIEAQNKCVIFLDHLYRCDGRLSKEHPMNGLYTGLWQDWCVKEAGHIVKAMYFERLEAAEKMKNFISSQLAIEEENKNNGI